MDLASATPVGAGGNEIDRPVPSEPSARVWGSDAIAAMLRELDIPYVALNPGSSYRGLHDSLVNYLGNRTEDVAGHAQIDHEDVGRLGRGDGKRIGGAGAHRDNVEVRPGSEHACNAIEQHRMIVNERN